MRREEISSSLVTRMRCYPLKLSETRYSDYSSFVAAVSTFHIFLLSSGQSWCLSSEDLVETLQDKDTCSVHPDITEKNVSHLSGARANCTHLSSSGLWPTSILVVRVTRHIANVKRASVLTMSPGPRRRITSITPLHPAPVPAFNI